MTSDKSQPSPSAQMQQLLIGYQRTQLIHVAAKLGIADLLKDGPKSSEDLAQASGAHPQFLYRILRALASMGIFAENEDKWFENTPLSETLLTDAPGTLHYGALQFGGEAFWRSWGSLYQSAVTGKNTFPLAFGVKYYEYLDQHPETQAVFNKQQAMNSSAPIAAIIDAYDFSGVTKLVDVGGGHGQLITAILKKYPDMRGVLLDLPQVVDGAKAQIKDQNLTDRLQLVGGSFFDTVPDGDACVIKSVLMDYNDDSAAAILKNCRKSVGANGRIIVVERILQNTADKIMDINMMVMSSNGGLVRTEKELTDLHSEAGLKLVRIVPTASPFSVLESVPS